MNGTSYRLRPSAAGTWVRCHGFVRMTADVSTLVPGEDNTVQLEGTAGHWAAHQASQGISVPLGTTAPNGVMIDDELLDGVDMHLDVVRSWGAQAAPRFEQALHCRRVHQECGGTADVVGYDPLRRILHICDLKFGYRIVQVSENWQMIAYAAGAMDFYGVKDLETTVQFTIVQPRASHRDGPVRVHTVPAAFLRNQINVLHNAANAAMGDDPKCIPNPGCPNCGARHRCVAAQEAAGAVMENASDATPHDLPFPAAEAELVRLKWAAEIVGARITGLEQQVMHSIKRGAISRHYGLTQSVGRLAWRDGVEPQVMATAKLFGASITKPAQLITPTQAKQKLPAGIVDGLSHRPPGAMKLVQQDASTWRKIFESKPL